MITSECSNTAAAPTASVNSNMYVCSLKCCTCVHVRIDFVISDNPAVTDISLKALGKACRNLECISIAGCSRVTDHGLKGLNSLKSLISLNVADCVR